MHILAELLAIIGMSSISVALVVLGVLSRRIGRVTRTRAYYIGLYVAAGLVAVGPLARLVNFMGWLVPLENLQHNILWLLLYNGLPCVGITIGVVVAWRYWSWLLAERG